MMMPASVAYVGLALWLADHGIGPERIGLINALPLAVVVVLGVSVGRLADRASDWRGAIVACSTVAAVASAGLFFVYSFWDIAIVWTLTMAPLLLMIPIVDAATVRMAQRSGRPLRGDPRLGHGRLYRGHDPDRLGDASLWRRSVRRPLGCGQRAAVRDRAAAAAIARAGEARRRRGDRAANPVDGGGIERFVATLVPGPRARGLSIEREPLRVERLWPPVVEARGRLRRSHWNLPRGA
jgi:hypothetical protein